MHNPLEMFPRQDRNPGQHLTPEAARYPLPQEESGSAATGGLLRACGAAEGGGEVAPFSERFPSAL